MSFYDEILSGEFRANGDEATKRKITDAVKVISDKYDAQYTKGASADLIEV